MSIEPQNKTRTPIHAYGEAYNLFINQKYDEAYDLIQRDIQNFPNSLQLRLLLAEIAFQRFEYNESLKTYLNVYSATKLSFIALRIAESYDQNKNYSQAAHYYLEALKLGSQYADYIHPKLSRVYLYLHDDVASSKYEKKANKSKRAPERAIAYPFSNYQSISKRKAPTKSSNLPKVFVFVMLLISALLVPLVLNVSKTEYVETEYESSVSEVSEAAVAISDDTSQLASEKVMTISNHTHTFYKKYELYDYGVSYNYDTFGNTNSNILNNSIACEYYGDDYFFKNNILYFNYDEEDEESIFTENNLTHLNIYDENIFYIYNAKYHGDAQVRAYSLYDQSSIAFDAPFADNLLVDETNFYYITRLRDGYALNYKRYYAETEPTVFPIKDISYLNQTEFSIYFISNNRLYKIPKSKLDPDYHELSNVDILQVHDNLLIDSLVVEGDYCYYSKVGEYGLFRNMLSKDSEIKINDEFDCDTMYLNIYQDRIYMGSKFDSEGDTNIFSKSGLFLETKEAFPFINITENFVYYNATIFY